MQPRLFALTSFLASAAAGLAAVEAEISPAHIEFFESKVRPILKENCYKCHSLEAGKAKGGLTLDTREGLQKGGEEGPVVEPGAPEKSRMIAAIGYADPDLQMPPKGEKLSSGDIAVLTEWVKMGAPDPRKGGAEITSKLSGLTSKAREHWAYQPVQKPGVPTNKNQQWCRTPVDAFVLQKLEAAGMVPAPDTDRETLLRRATYDLLGLPPTPSEVEAFLADKSENAFEKVVDRLLASPHYGERWGRYWLDTARYSDTVGGERNLQRRGMDYRYPYAWTYRDYVVQAFNADKPYDQFIREQLAADLLPEAKDPKTLAALGFLTVGERFRNQNDIINDRIDVVSKGFLAMTVTCARCHDHMFDPIPTKDYYALHGVFASTFEPDEKPVIAAPQQQEQIADYQAKLAELEAQNRAVYYKLVVDVNGEAQRKMGAIVQVAQEAGGGKRGQGSAEEIKARNALLNKHKLDRDLLQLVMRNTRRDTGIFMPATALMRLSPTEFPLDPRAFLERLGRRGGRATNAALASAFAATPPVAREDVVKLYEEVFAKSAARLKEFAAAKARNETLPDLEPGMDDLIQTPLPILPASELTTERIRNVVSTLPQQLAGRTPFVFARINELELTHPGAPARAMLISDTPRPKNSPVFIRGQAEARGEIVPRRFLEVLSPGGAAPFKEGSGRLELAQAIASKSNPLTARVMVNRVWMHHFGEGFVPTPDDLGTQSEPPSHPELVDYLASYFMEQNWSLKKLHKLIMLSRVYRESTQTNAAYEVKDPQNRLLWRANLRRLDFEAMRDSLLVFSGNLDRTIGGKPINLTEEPYSYRRSVYGYIDRGNLPEVMAQFDFSDPDMPNSKRNTTVVPQQALFLMNSAMSIDVARRILEQPAVAQAPDNLRRIMAIYRVIFQRSPKPAEIQMALNYVGSETAMMEQDPGAEELTRRVANRQAARTKVRAQQQAKNRYAGMAAIKNSGEMVERKPLTPWESYAQALLLSNEAAYVN